MHLIFRCLASVMLAVGLTSLVGCGKVSEPADATPAVARSAETRTFGVEGMHCDGCANAITTKVSKVDGVQSCEVSLDDATATVAADPAVFDEVQAAIAKLGYDVTPASPASSGEQENR